MLFEQGNLLMLMDESATPDQWEFANLGLDRQLSLDTTLWDVLLDEPSTSIPPLKIEECPITQSSMSDASQDSEATHHQVLRDKRCVIKGSDSNYEKNICAYITKKAVQCFIQPTYRRKVQRLCEKGGCTYAAAMVYYGQRYKEVFGITLLTLLISPQEAGEVGMKHAFTVFLKWFLREKYMLYLLKNGKMSEKEKYIEFKNKYLLYISKSEESFKTC